MDNTRKKSISRILIVLAIIAVVMLISIMTERNNADSEVIAQDTIYLFNGEDLDNWVIVLEDSMASSENTFFIRAGVIATTGDPFGYIRTKDRYSDYNLFTEWRWVDEPGNSGVFLHIQNDDIWPVCLECQLMNQKAGDFVCFPGFDFNEHLDKENWAVAKIDEVSEKPAGEWNQYDIRVNDDSVSIYVNGVLQNIATGTNYTEGHIALQSEGAPLEFRNVYLVKENEDQ